MKAYIFIAMILLFLSPAFAEDSGQQLNVSSTAEEQLARGFDYISAGDYKKAVQFFEKETILNPGNPNGYIGLAVSYLKLGDNEFMTITELVGKAVVAGRKALVLGADYPVVHATLGLCYVVLNNRDAAIREYEILKDLDTDLADKLKNSIDRHQSPESYVQTGEEGNYIPQSKEESQNAGSGNTNDNRETTVIRAGEPKSAPQGRVDVPDDKKRSSESDPVIHDTH